MKHNMILPELLLHLLYQFRQSGGGFYSSSKSAVLR